MPLDLPSIDDIYFSEEFKVMVRSNKEFLISRSQRFPIIDKALVEAHKYNFYNVLRILTNGSITQSHAWVIAYINDIKNPDQNISGMESYLYVDQTVIDQMLSRMNTERS